MSNRSSALAKLVRSVFLLFTRVSMPRYIVGITWAVLLHQAIYFAGSQTTGLYERVFHDPRIFPFSTGGVLFATVWLACTALFMVRTRPRYNEWAVPFGTGPCFWLLVWLQHACDDTAYGSEMGSFAAAMLLTCGTILCVPILTSVAKYLWRLGSTPR